MTLMFEACRLSLDFLGSPGSQQQLMWRLRLGRLCHAGQSAFRGDLCLEERRLHEALEDEVSTSCQREQKTRSSQRWSARRSSGSWIVSRACSFCWWWTPIEAPLVQVQCRHQQHQCSVLFLLNASSPFWFKTPALFWFEASALFGLNVSGLFWCKASALFGLKASALVWAQGLCASLGSRPPPYLGSRLVR